MENKKTFAHKAGDAIERAGEKLKGAGLEKAGQAVYKAGNKLEHKDDVKADVVTPKKSTI